MSLYLAAGPIQICSLAQTRKYAEIEQNDIANEKKQINKKYYKTRCRNNVGDMRVKNDNITLTNDNDKADVFGNYFSLVFQIEGDDEIEVLPRKVW